MFYFFITFTTVPRAYQFCGRMSITEGLKLDGCALWFLIPTEWLFLGWKVACTFFHLSLNIDTFQGLRSNVWLETRRWGENGLSYVLTMLRKCLIDCDSLGITFDTFLTKKAFVELVNFFLLLLLM